MSDYQWLEQLTRKVFSWLSRGEVKTPLSFFFKVVPWITAAWIAILYSPVPNDAKFQIIQFSALVFVGLCCLVAVFAFVRPKHLVYGETGYRAESKFTFGTEKKEMTQSQIANLEGIEKPNVLPVSGETS